MKKYSISNDLKNKFLSALFQDNKKIINILRNVQSL